jgi:hypothetical protein
MDYVGPDYPNVTEGVWDPPNLSEEELAEWYQTYLGRWDVSEDKRVTPKELAKTFSTWANEKQLPYEEKRKLALLMTAQGQQEGAWAGMGRSPRNNPFNVGEFDQGTKQTFNSPEQGIRAYLDLMYNDYRPESGDWLELVEMGRFINRAGNRYASDPDYETKNRGHINLFETGKTSGFGPYPSFPR